MGYIFYNVISFSTYVLLYAIEQDCVCVSAVA